jgi:DNA-binding transcriptional LysR family regulator
MIKQVAFDTPILPNGASLQQLPRMNRIPHTSIEQWAVLRVIVDTGGFAQAAEHLHRSQSSVSYSVAKLQERLGVRLLQIDGRKAHLTEAGRSLLADVTPLIDDLIRLEERARFIAGGHEARVRLLADSVFPKRILFSALAAFETAYPHVHLELRETVRQKAPDAADASFDLALSVWSLDRPDSQRLLDVRMTAVAHCDHPLVCRNVVTHATLARFRRVAIHGERSAPSASAPQNQSATWLVNTVEAAIEAVTSGLCYGWLPRHLIENELESGRLVELQLGSRSQRLVALTLSFADEDRAGPATRALASILLAHSNATTA